jgi:hypothetical protein
MAVFAGLGGLVALAAALTIWYFMSKGADHLPGPLRDIAHQAIDGPSGSPALVPISPETPTFSASQIEKTTRDELEAEIAAQPRYAGAVITRVSCGERDAPSGVDQRFSCAVWVNNVRLPKDLVLNVIGGRVSPVMP